MTPETKATMMSARVAAAQSECAERERIALERIRAAEDAMYPDVEALDRAVDAAEDEYYAVLRANHNQIVRAQR